MTWPWHCRERETQEGLSQEGGTEEADGLDPGGTHPLPPVMEASHWADREDRSWGAER